MRNFTLDVRGEQPLVKGQLKASEVIFFVRGMAKEDEAKLPHHSLESNFSASGNSTSALAASLDGYFWVRSSPGQFRSLDLARIRDAMRTPVLVDLRNVYEHDEVTRHGFAYFSVGRPAGSGGMDALSAAAE